MALGISRPPILHSRGHIALSIHRHGTLASSLCRTGSTAPGQVATGWQAVPLLRLVLLPDRHPAATAVAPRRLPQPPRSTSSAVSPGVPTDPPQQTAPEKLAEVLTMMFPVWALLSGALAFFHPPSLNWMSNR